MWCGSGAREDLGEELFRRKKGQGQHPRRRNTRTGQNGHECGWNGASEARMEPGKDQMAHGLVLSNRMGRMPVPGFKKMIGLDSCQTKIILAASWKVSYGQGKGQEATAVFQRAVYGDWVNMVSCHLSK